MAAGVPSTRSRSRGASTILVLVAALGSLVGLAVAVGTYLGQPSTVTSVGRAGDLTLKVNGTRWVAHEMDAMPGMAMAGMPAPGLRRLHLEVAMSNRGHRPRTFGPHQFRLASADRRWGIKTSSFVTGALGPGQTMAGDLFFDVPEKSTDASLRLAWMPPGRDVLFRLATNGGDGRHARDPHDATRRP